MRRALAQSAAAIALVCAGLPAAGQSFAPKSIKFTGTADYSDQELLRATGLQPGTVLSYAEMNNQAQKLIDTGIFSTVSFKFDGQDLVFQVTPSTGLVPLRLQNLSIAAGKDLDEKLYRQFPLYHGLLPEQGGLTQSVRGALEQMITSQGIKGTVTATPYKDPELNKTTAVNFAITAPPVLVGELRTEGAIVALDPKASALLAKFPGTPYDAHETAKQIEGDLSAYYKDQGYPDPSIHATAAAKPSLTANAIRISLRVSILPGAQFKLAGIQLAPGLLITQSDFDRGSHLHPGDSPDGEHLRESWTFIEHQYHDHGYIKAKVQPAPTYDQHNRTVTYVVSVDPGPEYTMGKLTIDNVTDDLRAQMMSAWKMPAGAVFNEGAVAGFFSTRGVNPALEQVLTGVNYSYSLHPNDTAHTVDLTLTLEQKH